MSLAPNRPRTVSDVAKLVAEQTGAAEASIARLLRDVIARKVVLPATYGGTGPTAPALFDEAATCRAVLLMELDRLGLSTDSLIEAASKCLNNERGRDGDGYGPTDTPGRADRLATIIPKLRAAETWYFHLYLIPEYFGRAGNVLGGTFSESTDGQTPHPFAITITLPLLPILGPIVQQAEAN